MNYKPKAITKDEWREIAAVQEVREGWGIESEEDSENVRAGIYAAKFEEYMTDGPGYAGELYVLIGGVPETPVVIIRRKGQLVAVDSEGWR
jgi:hypothetical protein